MMSLEMFLRNSCLVSVLKRENQKLREENEALKNKNKEVVEEEKKLNLEILSLKVSNYFFEIIIFSSNINSIKKI